MIKVMLEGLSEFQYVFLLVTLTADTERRIQARLACLGI